MEIKEILRWGHPALMVSSREVTLGDLDFVRWLSVPMHCRAYHDEMRGIGLAACQIGIQLRFFVVDPELAQKQGLPSDGVVVNPKVVKCFGKPVAGKEGCLSCRGFTLSVGRCEEIEVSYQDVEGNPRTQQLTGLLARVFQHETDHCNGLFHVDKTIPRFRKKNATQRILRRNAAVAKEQQKEEQEMLSANSIDVSKWKAQGVDSPWEMYYREAWSLLQPGISDSA